MPDAENDVPDWGDREPWVPFTCKGCGWQGETTLPMVRCLECDTVTRVTSPGSDGAA